MCYVRNVHDHLAVGETPYERRFGEPFKGPVIPFGAMVEYHPISARDQSKLHQFGKKVLPGVFLGFALIGREGIWKGYTLVADIEELENLDPSEIHARRLNAKEVITPKKGTNKIIPVAHGTAKMCGRDHGVREFSLRRDQPVMSEDLREELQGNLERSQPTETKDGAEARNDFWSMEGDIIYRHHVEPQVHVYVPNEESFPISLKYIDVPRDAHKFRCIAKKSINDCWNVHGNRTLPDTWTGFTKFPLLNEKTSSRVCVVLRET